MRCVLLFLVCSGHVVMGTRDYSVENFMKTRHIVPDVIPLAPYSYLFVDFLSGINVELGNLVPPSDTSKQPLLEWMYEYDKYYTVMMFDPDEPSFGHQIKRERIHWLLTNVRGNDLPGGQTVFPFLGSNPERDSGLHRYVFLVYDHQYPLDYNETVADDSLDVRDEFSIELFTRDNYLRDPVYGNFYRCYFDFWVDYIDKL